MKKDLVVSKRSSSFAAAFRVTKAGGNKGYGE